MPHSDLWTPNRPVPACDCGERLRRNERFGLGLLRWWCVVHGVCEPCPICGTHGAQVTPLERTVRTASQQIAKARQPRQASLFGDGA